MLAGANSCISCEKSQIILLPLSQLQQINLQGHPLLRNYSHAELGEIAYFLIGLSIHYKDKARVSFLLDGARKGSISQFTEDLHLPRLATHSCNFSLNSACADNLLSSFMLCNKRQSSKFINGVAPHLDEVQYLSGMALYCSFILVFYFQICKRVLYLNN